MIIRLIISMCIIFSHAQEVDISSSNLVDPSSKLNPDGYFPSVNPTNSEKVAESTPSIDMNKSVVNNTMNVTVASTAVPANASSISQDNLKDKTVTNEPSHKENLVIRNADDKEAPIVLPNNNINEASSSISNGSVVKSKENGDQSSKSSDVQLPPSSEKKPEPSGTLQVKGDSSSKGVVSNGSISSEIDAIIEEDKKSSGVSSIVEKKEEKSSSLAPAAAEKTTSVSSSTSTTSTSSSTTTKAAATKTATTKPLVVQPGSGSEDNSDIFIEDKKPFDKIVYDDDKKPEAGNNFLPKPPGDSNSISNSNWRDNLNDDGLLMVATDTKNDQDSHFFAYFASLCIVLALCYFIYHNKNRIMALVLEGRRGRASSGRRGSGGLAMRRRGGSGGGAGGGTKYQPLHNNLDEVLTEGTRQSTLDRIY